MRFREHFLPPLRNASIHCRAHNRSLLGSVINRCNWLQITLGTSRYILIRIPNLCYYSAYLSFLPYTKCQHLNLKVRQMSWFLGRKSKLSLENKTLIYKCILNPIWTYGIQLWGCAKPSNTKTIQRLQSNVLRTITNAPWYVSNFTLHNGLQIPFITEEIKRFSTIYYNRLIGHENSYVTELSNPLNLKIGCLHPVACSRSGSGFPSNATLVANPEPNPLNVTRRLKRQ
jgi:hypothetical protein